VESYVAQGSFVVGNPVEERALVQARGNAVDSEVSLTSGRAYAHFDAVRRNLLCFEKPPFAHPRIPLTTSYNSSKHSYRARRSNAAVKFVKA
jgi:hypothetical protein